MKHLWNSCCVGAVLMTNPPRNFAPSMTMMTAFRHAAISLMMAVFACVPTLCLHAQTEYAQDN